MNIRIIDIESRQVVSEFKDVPDDRADIYATINGKEVKLPGHGFIVETDMEDGSKHTDF